MSQTYYICFFFFFNDTATTEIYTLSLHDALPIYALGLGAVYLVVAALGFIAGDGDEIFNLIPVNTEDNVLHLLIGVAGVGADRKSTRLNSSHANISYAVFCLKKKKTD